MASRKVAPSLLVGGMIVLGTGMFRVTAQARPQYTQKEKVECVHCHVGAGGPRGFRGQYYAAHARSFADFDEEFEAKMAGVKPNSKGPESRATTTGYPRYTVPVALGFSVKDIDGKTVNLGRYQGQVLLVVNVASKCGNTPQYASLQKLYRKHQAEGFSVLGFPSNDFGMQEPGTESEIKEFCNAKYQVTFPMFSKIVVKGDGQAPLYRFLTDKKANPLTGGDIEWNFAKFLINRKGEVVARFPAGTDPLDPKVLQVIEREIAVPREATRQALRQ